MYGYSSLLRGALCLGIFCGIFAASLHSFQKNPAQFLRAADAAYGVGFLHHAGTQQAGEYLMWLTKDSENCAFNEEDARQRLAYRLTNRCQEAGGTVVASFMSERSNSFGVCDGVVRCKLPINGD